MIKVKKKKTEQRKNIDLPITTISVLCKMATAARMPVKNYIEKVLIELADKNKRNG